MRGKLSLISFFAGLATSIASCAGYYINYMPATYEFGLIQALPPLFWVGFAICLLSLLEGIGRDREGVFFVKAFLFSMLIWNIPTLLLAHPYHQDSYLHPLGAWLIMSSGHVPPVSESLPGIFLYYPASFPGYFILLSSIFQITDIAPLELARYYPLFSSALTFLAIWLFIKTFLPSAGYRWALLITILANVYMQFHVSPQSVGLVAGLLTLVALEKAGWGWKVTAVLLFAYITVSHPTTAFIVLSVAGLAWLLRILIVKDRKLLLEPAPLLIIGWIAWSVFYASPFGARIAEFAAAGPPPTATSLTGIALVDNLLAPITDAILRPGGIFVWAPKIRLAVQGVFGIGSVYYLVRQWLNKSNRSQKQLFTYTAFLAGPAIVAALDLIFLKLGWHLYDRYFLFFLLVAPILLVSLAEGIGHPPLPNSGQERPASGSAPEPNRVKPKRRFPIARNAFLLALVFLALFNFATAYYRAPIYITGDEGISASEFVNKNTSSQIIGGRAAYVPDFTDLYSSAILRYTRFYTLYPQPITSLSLPSIVVLDDHDIIRYQDYVGIEKYDFYAREAADRLDKVYSNGRYNIYWFPGKN